MVLRTTVAAAVCFRVKASSGGTGPASSASAGSSVVEAGCGWTVADLKRELEAQGLSGGRHCEQMKLVLKGKTLADDDLIGEYTGTAGARRPSVTQRPGSPNDASADVAEGGCGAAARPRHATAAAAPLPLLVLSQASPPPGASAAAALGVGGAATRGAGSEGEVRVSVTLPNGRCLSLDVAATTSLLAVKGILATSFGVAPPRAGCSDRGVDLGTFELFCAATRKPLPAAPYPTFPAAGNPAVDEAVRRLRPPGAPSASSFSSSSSSAALAAAAATGCSEASWNISVAEALRRTPPVAPLAATDNRPAVIASVADTASPPAACDPLAPGRRKEPPRALKSVIPCLSLLLLPAIPLPLPPLPRWSAGAVPGASAGEVKTGSSGAGNDVGTDAGKEPTGEDVATDVIRVTTFAQLDDTFPVRPKTAQKTATTATAASAGRPLRPAQLGASLAAKGARACPPPLLAAPASACASSAGVAFRTSSAAAAVPPMAQPSTVLGSSGGGGGGHRPSRPAAHPKERMSKVRAGFAGLKRGFLTPEKMRRPSPDTPETPPSVSPGQRHCHALSATASDGDGGDVDSGNGDVDGVGPGSGTPRSPNAPRFGQCAGALPPPPLVGDMAPTVVAPTACDEQYHHHNHHHQPPPPQQQQQPQQLQLPPPAMPLSPPVQRARPRELRPSWASLAPRSPAAAITKATDKDVNKAPARVVLGPAAEGPTTASRGQTRPARSCPLTPTGLLVSFRPPNAAASSDTPSAATTLAARAAADSTASPPASRTAATSPATSPARLTCASEAATAATAASGLPPRVSPDHGRGAPRGESFLNGTAATTNAAGTTAQLSIAGAGPSERRISAHGGAGTSRAERLAVALDRAGGGPKRLATTTPASVWKAALALGGHDAPSPLSPPPPPPLSTSSPFPAEPSSPASPDVAQRQAPLRCSVCAKRLRPWDAALGPCRCGLRLCGKHLHSASHACAFDFAASELERARPGAVPLLPAKLQYI